MSLQITRKSIKNDAIDGSKILLSNNDALRSKNFAGADVDLIKLDASDKIIISSAPLISSTGSESNSVQTKAQISAAILVETNRAIAAEGVLATAVSDEEARAIAAEAALQLAISTSATNLKWRPSVIAITEDADLANALEGATLSALLPFSDDEAPNMVIGDFSVGDFIISSNGNESQLFKVYNDAGTLKLTLLGFDALAADHTFVVVNDLVDSPAGQENRSIWTYSGLAMVKLGDFDWALASGIDLSASYLAAAGTVTVGDSVEVAIAKIVGNLSAEIGRATSAEGVIAGNLATEISNRAIAEGNLQDNIDAEAGLRIDADVFLQDSIDTEYDRAIAAEGLLDGRIVILENAVPSWHKMKKVLSAGDVSNGYIDLDHTMVPDSLIAFTGRLGVHKTEDYTVSTVSSKTRLTFVNSMAVGQAEAIAENDNFFFTYQF